MAPGVPRWKIGGFAGADAADSRLRRAAGSRYAVGRYRAERGDFPFARALVIALRPAREADTEETAFTLLCCAEKGTLPDGVVGFTPEDAPERLRYVEV